MHQLTLKQRETLEFIRGYTAIHEKAPCLREIATACGITPPTAKARVDALANKGYIKRRKGRIRRIATPGRQS